MVSPGMRRARPSHSGPMEFFAWLSEPDAWVALVTLAGFEFSGRDIVLIVGGLFLLWKSTTEIHAALEGDEPAHGEGPRRAATFSSVIIQIGLLDIVFSLDSVITAVGMADDIP